MVRILLLTKRLRCRHPIITKGILARTARLPIACKMAIATAPWKKKIGQPPLGTASRHFWAAEPIAGPYRAKINAATMLAPIKDRPSKRKSIRHVIDRFPAFQCPIHDRNLCRTTRVNLYSMEPGLEYRPLEGFIYAITLSTLQPLLEICPPVQPLMGNVWLYGKPSDSQVYSAKVILDVFKEAGVPTGVINMVMGDPVMINRHPSQPGHFSGLHFTGSTHVFKDLWKKIGMNIDQYKTYHECGETGENFIVIQNRTSKQVATAIVRGAFEFQGQKMQCNSRCYISKSIWGEVGSIIKVDLASIKMGSPERYDVILLRQ